MDVVKFIMWIPFMGHFAIYSFKTLTVTRLEILAKHAKPKNNFLLESDLVAECVSWIQMDKLILEQIGISAFVHASPHSVFFIYYKRENDKKK